MTILKSRPVCRGSDLYTKLTNRMLRGAVRVASCGRRVNPSDTARSLYGPHAEDVVTTYRQHARIAALVVEHLRGPLGWECHVIDHGRRAAEAALDQRVTMDGEDKALDREDKLTAKLMRLALDLTDEPGSYSIAPDTIIELERIARQSIRGAGKLAPDALEILPQLCAEGFFSPVNPDCVVQYFDCVIAENQKPRPKTRVA
jgi:hypothetical protein